MLQHPTFTSGVSSVMFGIESLPETGEEGRGPYNRHVCVSEYIVPSAGHSFSIVRPFFYEPTIYRERSKMMPKSKQPRIRTRNLFSILAKLAKKLPGKQLYSSTIGPIGKISDSNSSNLAGKKIKVPMLKPNLISTKMPW